jgi:hypothetical protein
MTSKGIFQDVHGTMQSTYLEITEKPGLLSLCDDLMLKVLGHLHWKDLNEFAIVAKRCRTARSNPRLNQTREAIICLVATDSSGMRTMSLEQLLALPKRWKARMSRHPAIYYQIEYHNFNQLRVERKKYDAAKKGSDSWPHILQPSFWFSYVEIRKEMNFPLVFPTLNQAQSIAFKNSGQAAMNCDVYQFLVSLHPRIRGVNISEAGSLDDYPHEIVPSKFCEFFTEIQANNSKTIWHWRVVFDGCRSLGNVLKAISVDDSILLLGSSDEFLFHNRRKLESVSCKGTYKISMKPLSQKELMDFVWNAPKLRRFRSDLTAENISILQKERPEIQFLS